MIPCAPTREIGVNKWTELELGEETRERTEELKNKRWRRQEGDTKQRECWRAGREGIRLIQGRICGED